MTKKQLQRQRRSLKERVAALNEVFQLLDAAGCRVEVRVTYTDGNSPIPTLHAEVL